MVTRKQIDGANPEKVVEQARHWIWTAGEMETAADDYKGHLDRPGGQHWEGETAEAVQSRGADDRKAIHNMGDALSKLGTDTVNTVTESVMPALKNVRQLIENAEKIPGFTVNDDLSVSYDPPQGTSEERAQQCRDACARFSEQIKDAAEKWWVAEQHAGELIDRAAQALSGNFNPLAQGLPMIGSLTHELGWLDRVLSARENQENAFRRVFGRVPNSPADWQTAAMLDAHNYDPKYKGVQSEVSAARIDRQPGKGVVQVNAFIPGQQVWNFGHDKGDNRGFDVNAKPEQARGNLLIDYENGLVVARDNPSVSVESGNVAVHKPDVTVVQGSGGAVNVKWDMADGFVPGGAVAGKLTAHSVAGEMVVKPSEGGGYQIGGHMSDFPAYEVYGNGQPIYQYMPSMGHDERGPLVQLMGDHEFGNPSLLDQFHVDGFKVFPPGPTSIRVDSVQLGPIDNVPTAPTR